MNDLHRGGYVKWCHRGLVRCDVHTVNLQALLEGSGCSMIRLSGTCLIKSSGGDNRRIDYNIRWTQVGWGLVVSQALLRIRISYSVRVSETR